MKLWQKGDVKQSEQSMATEKFTVGNDRIWDMRIAQFDVQGSIAHAAMLEEIGIITAAESIAIKVGLEQILEEIHAGTFTIEPQVEDVHSQVEKLLTGRIGEAGKRLHTGRSRNDQVLVDIKLYLKHTLRETATMVLDLFALLQTLSERHKNELLPGYTHFQLAMPSSFGLWFGAYAESLADDMELLVAAFKVADKNPLGSGAGYGSAFPLNRTLTTALLGFGEMNHNVVYAQMTRGKAEKATLTAFASIASTLSRLSYDICLYMNQQFAYVSFPDSLTTGSSIMPHKKNPDIFELIRAKCNRLQATPNEMTLMTNNLPSGYHRDMQLTKDILFPAIDAMQECLGMMTFSLQDIQVRKQILNDAVFNDLFSVEEINKLVVQGVPFREAYKIVGTAIHEPAYSPSRTLAHTHEGSINNLHTAEIKTMMDRVVATFGL
jgi:argininosuccinate lyase